ncbi:MAG: ROK family glucokinase [Nocardioidaceae bacterium]|nr:ROK family glucokinase [Nocardioidaceae bacterium]
MALSVGVDIGGTKIAAGVVDEAGTILAVEKEPTPASDPVAIADAVGAAVDRLRREHDVSAVGIGAAGFIDVDRSTVLFAPNISWTGEPLGEHVTQRVRLPVVVENDANAAAWGEFRFGAGAEVDDLVLVTVGTGVGGGLVMAGRLQRGAFGLAGEVGHLRVVPEGLRCGCGRYGCWEQYASGRALVREARGQILSDLPEAQPLAALVGGDVDLLTGPMITALAQDGDPLCRELLGEIGRWLGEGIASLAAVLDPAVVVLGGGVAAAGPLLLEPAQHALTQTLPAAMHRTAPELRLAVLGNEGGMIGAADLARQR